MPAHTGGMVAQRQGCTSSLQRSQRSCH